MLFTDGSWLFYVFEDFPQYKCYQIGVQHKVVCIDESLC